MNALTKEKDAGMNFDVLRNCYDINIRYTYALKSIGKGQAAARMFSSLMNLALPNVRFAKYNEKLLSAATEVCEASMRHRANQAIEENDGSKDIAAAFDGSWQKRGHTSMNGVLSVTSFDAGKIIDFECCSKSFVLLVFTKVSKAIPKKKHLIGLGATVTIRGPAEAWK